MGILASASFEVRSTYHPSKGKIPDKLVFGRAMILPINHVGGWRYIRQQKKAKIDKDVIFENTTRINNDYRVGYKVMIQTKSVFKYKTLFRGTYEIDHT